MLLPIDPCTGYANGPATVNGGAALAAGWVETLDTGFDTMLLGLGATLFACCSTKLIGCGAALVAPCDTTFICGGTILQNNVI